MTRTPAAVAPSSGDATRENPLRLPPGGTFTLELDPPTGPHAAREAWELRSDDERYRRRLTRADAVLDPATEAFRLVFEGLFEDATYTLLLQGEGEARIALFSGIAYEDLVDRGEQTDAPAEDQDDETEETGDEDPVETESDDDEVQHDPDLDELAFEEPEDDADDELHDVIAPFGDDPEDPPEGGLGSDDAGPDDGPDADADDQDDHDDAVDHGPGGHGSPPPPASPGGRP